MNVAIIGAGIVGLATGLELTSRFPGISLAVIEKESVVAGHQSSHNSGVIHSGIYYKPGSLKAKLCVEGAEALLRFCQENAVPYDICGKVIVRYFGERTATARRPVQAREQEWIEWVADADRQRDSRI